MLRRRRTPPTLLAVGLLVAAAGVAAQVGSAVPAQALAATGAGTHLRVSGPSGDWITQGRAHSFAVPKDRFNAVVQDGGSRLTLGVSPGGGVALWDLHLAAPTGQRLTAGRTYTAQRSAPTASTAGFDLGADGRGCNAIAATFTISRLSFTADGLVPAFVATFRASCDSGPEFSGDVAIFGHAFTPPRPSPDPARSTGLRFSGPPREFISQGRAWSYAPSNATFTTSVTDGGHHLHVFVSPDPNSLVWTLDLAAPPGERLVAGKTYKARRYPAPPDPDPGFALSGFGRACNELTAWVTVWQASFTADDRIRAFDATFVQFCESGDTWVTGEVSVFAPGAEPAVPSRSATPSPGRSSTPASVTPPAAKTVSDTSASGSASGSVDVLGLAEVRGTTPCPADGTVTVSGAVTQQLSVMRTAGGRFSVTVRCTGPSANWRTSITSTSGTPFTRGPASVTGPTSATVLLG